MHIRVLIDVLAKGKTIYAAITGSLQNHTHCIINKFVRNMRTDTPVDRYITHSGSSFPQMQLSKPVATRFAIWMSNVQLISVLYMRQISLSHLGHIHMPYLRSRISNFLRIRHLRLIFHSAFAKRLKLTSENLYT